jgi:hypothetical protein
VVARPRILIECALIERVQSRTIQRACDWIHKLSYQGHDGANIAQQAIQCIRNTLLRSLKSKAKRVVTLKQCLSVVHSACNISEVYAGERVHRTGVTAYPDDIWVPECENGDIRLLRCG